MWSQVLITSLQSLLAVVTLVVNMVVFLALTLNPRQPLGQSIAMTLTTSLVVADLLIAVIAMPLAAFYGVAGTTYVARGFLCRFYSFHDVMLCTASILHLAGLACDRYLAICHPFLHHRLTSRKVKLTCLFLWLTSIVVSMPILVLPMTTAGNNNNSSSIGAVSQNTSSIFNVTSALHDLTRSGYFPSVPSCSPTETNRAYSVSIVILFFVVPLILIVVAHVAIVREVRSKKASPVGVQLYSSSPAQLHSSAVQLYSSSVHMRSSSAVQLHCPDDVIVARYDDSSPQPHRSSSDTRLARNGNASPSLCASRSELNLPHRSSSDSRLARNDRASPSLSASRLELNSPRHSSSNAKLATDDRASPSLSASRLELNLPHHSSSNARLSREASPMTASRLELNFAHHKPPKTKGDRAIKTVLCLVLCFCICWVPFFVVTLAMDSGDVTVSGDVRNVVLWLGFVNSTINPFLYYRFNRPIRGAIRRFLRLKNQNL